MKTVTTALFVFLGVVLSLTFASHVSAEDIVIRPKPAAGALDNPLKGWCSYTDAGRINQPSASPTIYQ